MEYESKNGSTVSLTGMYVGSGTTYISMLQDTADISSDSINCGPRCGMLMVTQIEDVQKVQENSWLYYCNSTVHEVEGDTDLHSENKINNRTAVTAAIGLSLSGSVDFEYRLFGFYSKK